MHRLTTNRYGKSRVRLLKVTRNPDEHNLSEWSVQVLLRGDFESAHTAGDNSNILATDTMKNTVYSVARSSSADSIEAYAKELIGFLLGRNPQVSSAEVTVESVLWKRLTVDGKPHPSSFMRGSAERQTTAVEQRQSGPFQITSGLDDLTLMKSADSGFSGFIRDSLTTLPETDDRLLGTSMRARWPYLREDLDFNAVRERVRESLLVTFANHKSRSVQETLFAIASAAIDSTPEIDEIEIAMPNKHALLVDLSRFGQTNPNQIFVPTDEPHGYIEARVQRAR